MDNNVDNLKKLIEKIKTIGFWERLFGWKSVQQQLIDAATDLQKLVTNSDNLRAQNTTLESQNSTLTTDLRVANEKVTRQELEIVRLNSAIQDNNGKLTQFAIDLSARETTIENQKARVNQLETDNGILAEGKNNLLKENKRLAEEAATNNEIITNHRKRKSELEKDLERSKEKLENLEQQYKAVTETSTKLLADEDNRRKKYENETATLTSIREQIQNDRNEEIENRNNAELERIKNLKETWSKHQENVKNVIKGICSKHTIEYVDKVPFKGEPDNTLKICEEFVIFDAKSPGAEDLTNFPSYLKDQTERAKKYAKQENVRSDIFFVVPTNTLEKLTSFVFNLGDYNVFIISVDSLEQIMLSLKKIEEYEFAEQLSPDERDNICRVLGKFAHLTKRRIQIDSFFAKQFIELAYKSEADLPKEIFEKVVEFEKSEKLNPPIEKRAKAINTKELEKDMIKINNEAFSKGIIIDDTKISKGLNELELYKPENE